jgi:beta-fructofuranosidase
MVAPKRIKPTETPIVETNAPACQTLMNWIIRYGFQPTVGWVGDPYLFMKMVFSIFICTMLNTLPTFHPWHKVTTSDFATFTDIQLK